MRRLAAVLGVTEGQAYTLVTGALVAIVLANLGLPPVVAGAGDEPGATPVAAPPPQPSPSPSPTPTPTAEPEPTTAPVPIVLDTPVAVPAEPLPPLEPQQPAPSPRPSPSPTPAPAGSDPGPPRIAYARYASASRPLVDGGEPGQLLPVGTLLGQDDKRSYLRFDRVPVSALTLMLDEDPRRQLLSVGVLACAITEESWEFKDGAPLDQAPTHDPDRCVAGERGEGAFTFGIGSLDARFGVALIPDATTPGTTARVTFARDDDGATASSSATGREVGGGRGPAHEPRQARTATGASRSARVARPLRRRGDQE